MKSDLERRISSLESRQPSADRKDRQILRRCTDAELDRYGEIARRYEDHIELTEEEMRFLAELEAKYAPL